MVMIFHRPALEEIADSLAEVLIGMVGSRERFVEWLQTGDEELIAGLDSTAADLMRRMRAVLIERMLAGSVGPASSGANVWPVFYAAWLARAVVARSGLVERVLLHSLVRLVGSAVATRNVSDPVALRHVAAKHRLAVEALKVLKGHERLLDLQQDVPLPDAFDRVVRAVQNFGQVLLVDVGAPQEDKAEVLPHVVQAFDHVRAFLHRGPWFAGGGPACRMIPGGTALEVLKTTELPGIVRALQADGRVGCDTDVTYQRLRLIDGPEVTRPDGSVFDPVSHEELKVMRTQARRPGVLMPAAVLPLLDEAARRRLHAHAAAVADYEAMCRSLRLGVAPTPDLHEMDGSVFRRVFVPAFTFGVMAWSMLALGVLWRHVANRPLARVLNRLLPKPTAGRGRGGRMVSRGTDTAAGWVPWLWAMNVPGAALVAGAAVQLHVGGHRLRRSERLLMERRVDWRVQGVEVPEATRVMVLPGVAAVPHAAEVRRSAGADMRVVVEGDGDARTLRTRATVAVADPVAACDVLRLCGLASVQALAGDRPGVIATPRNVTDGVRKDILLVARGNGMAAWRWPGLPKGTGATGGRLVAAYVDRVGAAADLSHVAAAENIGALHVNWWRTSRGRPALRVCGAPMLERDCWLAEPGGPAARMDGVPTGRRPVVERLGHLARMAAPENRTLPMVSVVVLSGLYDVVRVQVTYGTGDAGDVSGAVSPGAVSPADLWTEETVALPDDVIEAVKACDAWPLEAAAEAADVSERLHRALMVHVRELCGEKVETETVPARIETPPPVEGTEGLRTEDLQAEAVVDGAAPVEDILGALGAGPETDAEDEAESAEEVEA